MTELKRVGFWNNDSNYYPHLPNVKDFVDLTWDENERLLVADYLTTVGKENEAYKGLSICRICSKFNGSTDLTDGVYLWPEGFAHYVLEHGVKPPQDFLEHVWAVLGKVIEDATEEAMKKVKR